MMRARLLLVIALAATLGGCASSLSGIGGSERLSCKAPEGAQCTSVSGIYANTARGAPSVPVLPVAPVRAATPTPTLAPPTASRPTPAAATPLRSPPRILSLWIAPWEDRDGDLHEGSIVHVVVDSGRWLIEHVRPTPRNPFDAVSPPTTATREPTAHSAADTPPAAERLPLPTGSGQPSATTLPGALPR